MKFEEAIEKINDLFIEPCIPGYSSGDFAPEFLGQIEDLEEIIEQLQETYTPKIKMTSGQKSKLMMFIYENEEFEVLWYRYGYGGELYKEFSKNELMQAWLHPELIEVVDE